MDTGALVARVLPRDRNHAASRRGRAELEDLEIRLFSSEHVVDETVSLLVRQAGATNAARWARDHLASEEIVWLNTSREDWHEALRWLDKFSDQRLGFTDYRLPAEPGRSGRSASTHCTARRSAIRAPTKG